MGSMLYRHLSSFLYRNHRNRSEGEGGSRIKIIADVLEDVELIDRLYDSGCIKNNIFMERETP